jgi:hypothetical protein
MKIYPRPGSAAAVTVVFYPDQTPDRSGFAESSGFAS